MSRLWRASKKVILFSSVVSSNLASLTGPLVEGGLFSTFLIVVLITVSSLERRVGFLCP